MTRPDIEDLRKLYEHGAPKVMTLIEWAEGLEKGLRDVIADLESPCSCHEGFTSRRMVDPQCFHHGVMSTVRIAEKALGHHGCHCPRCRNRRSTHHHGHRLLGGKS